MNETEEQKFVLGRVENIMGKGGNACFAAFSPLTLSKTNPCFYMSAVQV